MLKQGVVKKKERKREELMKMVLEERKRKYQTDNVQVLMNYC